ncbi:hypothetical protein JTE90_003791 [Oedothorax gibbosus]|uniref:Uncharacterized protein n=1 Tax=Oedothorax gibbosus TaxID=931172 RepID=A0AAV6VCB9_9ARAC|nr:hypothetical protein JTE90_003791 [Oedothorax gibbosus]
MRFLIKREKYTDEEDVNDNIPKKHIKVDKKQNGTQNAVCRQSCRKKTKPAALTDVNYIKNTPGKRILKLSRCCPPNTHVLQKNNCYSPLATLLNNDRASPKIQDSVQVPPSRIVPAISNQPNIKEAVMSNPNRSQVEFLQLYNPQFDMAEGDPVLKHPFSGNIRLSRTAVKGPNAIPAPWSFLDFRLEEEYMDGFLKESWKKVIHSLKVQ